MTMSDRIAIINDGKLQQIAPPLECYNRPANVFVAGFIGSPSMNFFDGHVDDYVFETEVFDIDIEDTDLESVSYTTLGIRPEDIYLDESDLRTPSNEIRATVDVLEPVGEKIFVYLIPGDEGITAEPELDDIDDGRASRSESILMSAPSETVLKEGEVVEIVFDRSSIHLFDTRSGDALIHDLERETTAAP